MAFVAVIWILERQPPAVGETAELHEDRPEGGQPGRDPLLVVVGLAALTLGSMALVEGVRRLSGIESTQTRLGLVVVGFATAFELVVLAWSAGRRGMTDAVVGGVDRRPPRPSNRQRDWSEAPSPCCSPPSSQPPGDGTLDSTGPTVVYCAGGYRSSIGAYALRSLDFASVADPRRHRSMEGPGRPTRLPQP